MSRVYRVSLLIYCYPAIFYRFPLLSVLFYCSRTRTLGELISRRSDSPRSLLDLFSSICWINLPNHPLSISCLISHLLRFGSESQRQQTGCYGAPIITCLSSHPHSGTALHHASFPISSSKPTPSICPARDSSVVPLQLLLRIAFPVPCSPLARRRNVRGWPGFTHSRVRIFHFVPFPFQLFFAKSETLLRTPKRIVPFRLGIYTFPTFSSSTSSSVVFAVPLLRLGWEPHARSSVMSFHILFSFRADTARADMRTVAFSRLGFSFLQ